MSLMLEREKQDWECVKALAAQGIRCRSVWDFVKAPAPPEAVPILIGLLDRIDEPVVCEGVVRALTDKSAKGRAEEPLISMFNRLPLDQSHESLKWAIGNALSLLDRDRVSDALISIARDKRHGFSRQMIVSALAFVKNPKATSVLIDLLDDEDVNGHAIGALRARRAEVAIPHLVRFQDHPNSWKRRSAKNAIVALSKRMASATFH